MTTQGKSLQHGNFTGLAEDYSKYRPTYSESVLTAILSLTNQDVKTLDIADVGAGTGIWTRLMAQRNPNSIVAVEPNDDMRTHGIADSKNLPIQWFNGNGENTGLKSNSVNLVSMASSFHWVDFEKGTKEFHRVLKDNGLFVALWNPRLIEANPVLVEIEDYLNHLKGDNITRVSSGRSGITEQLTDLLDKSPYFDDVVYLEGRHVAQQSHEHYIGVWRSVNDIQYQLGQDKFTDFLKFIENKIQNLPYVETTYLTRAWVAKKIS